MEDPEKKKKKEDKAREKQLKKEKFLLKQAERQEQEQRSFHASKKNERKNAKHGAEDENSEDYVDPETPSGDKKRMSCQIAKQYSPSAVEKSWYEWWEKSGFFVADASSSKPPFVIVFPPPNVTGALHIGHALTVAIQ